MKRFFRFIRQLIATVAERVYASFSGGDCNGIYRGGWKRYDPDDDTI